MSLSPPELQRYARHLVLPNVGREGQERLRDASVLVVGVGGLGSPAALYLAAAGVGRLGLLDDDTVAVHNLQRQVLHDTSGVGTPKTASARSRLEALNPHVRIETWQTRLGPHNARGIIADYDVILDGTDAFASRYLVNDACILEGRPNVHASIHRFEGQLTLFGPQGAPCYRCVHPEPPPPGSVPDCAEGGVLGVLPGILGTLQATEALKLILGIGTPMTGRWLVVDALSMHFHEVRLEGDPSCAWCGVRDATELLSDYGAFCGVSASDDADSSATALSISPVTLAARLARGPVVVLDVREPWECAAAPFEGAQSIPMGQVRSRHSELPRNGDVVVLCHHGARSAMVAEFLRAVGFPSVLNLEGGIDRWSAEVDPRVPRY